MWPKVKSESWTTKGSDPTKVERLTVTCGHLEYVTTEYMDTITAIVRWKGHEIAFLPSRAYGWLYLLAEWVYIQLWTRVEEQSIQEHDPHCGGA